MIITLAVVVLSVGVELFKIQLHQRQAYVTVCSTAEKMIGSRTSVGGCEKKFQTILSLEFRFRERAREGESLCFCVSWCERKTENVLN